MANFIAVETKDSTVYVNVDYIVSITEDTDDDSSIIQIEGGATVNAAMNIEIIRDLLGDKISMLPSEEEADEE